MLDMRSCASSMWTRRKGFHLSVGEELASKLQPKVSGHGARSDLAHNPTGIWRGILLFSAWPRSNSQSISGCASPSFLFCVFGLFYTISSIGRRPSPKAICLRIMIQLGKGCRSLAGNPHSPSLVCLQGLLFLCLACPQYTTPGLS